MYRALKSIWEPDQCTDVCASKGDDSLIATLLFSGAVFCLVISFYFWLQVRQAKKEAHEQLEKYVGSVSEVRWSDRWVDRLDQQQWAIRLEPDLARASIKLRPGEYGALMVAMGMVMMFLFIIMFGLPFYLSFIVASSLVPFVSKFFLSSRRRIYIQRMTAQLGEVCRLLSSAARAGMSITQGLELVVKEIPDPMRRELGKVVREIQLGRDLDVSLYDLLSRANSKDLQVFVNALIIQRRAGGNLSQALTEMARTMEERKIINKTIDATIAQSRTSAYMLPFVSIGSVLLISQMMGNFQEFATSIFGIISILIFVVMQVIGFLLIKKISDIKV